MKLILLKRAYRNFGDHLIFNRARLLIEQLHPGVDIFEADGGDNLNINLSGINAIVIAGGPGYQTNAVPNLYPWASQVMKKNIPVYFLGAGVKDFPMIRRKYSFSQSSLDFLSYVDSFGGLGCRDYHSKSILDELGFSPSMNGCPVWYDLPIIGEVLVKPSPDESRCVLSVPGSPLFFNQFVKIVKLITHQFHNISFVVSFNHGITGCWESLFEEMKLLDIEILDVSGSEDSTHYMDCDFHIGYRVHTHLYFCSQRKPSLLIAEDGRGYGMGQTLGIPWLKGWNRTVSPFEYRVKRALHSLSFGYCSFVPDISSKVAGELVDMFHQNFNKYEFIKDVIDNNFPIMEKYLQLIVSHTTD
jgi:Polysaccharide pyruvyl transferase